VKALLNFIIRFHGILLFIVFEIISFTLVVSNNESKNTIFWNSANSFTGIFLENFTTINEYLSLGSQNEQLLAENKRLRDILTNLNRDLTTYSPERDSLYEARYYHIPARVVSNTVNRQYNYLTINKGEADGVKPEMAVVSPDGVVGIVTYVSENYSAVISILNIKTGLSARIKTSNYFGSVVWNGLSYRQVELKEIPLHINVNIGDTVVTSGYSIIFPEGEIIGTISGFEPEMGTNFYNITVDLQVDFKKVIDVYVIGDKHQGELFEIRDTLLNE